MHVRYVTGSAVLEQESINTTGTSQTQYEAQRRKLTSCGSSENVPVTISCCKDPRVVITILQDLAKEAQSDRSLDLQPPGKSLRLASLPSRVLPPRSGQAI